MGGEVTCIIIRSHPPFILWMSYKLAHCKAEIYLVIPWSVTTSHLDYFCVTQDILKVHFHPT